MITIAGRNLHFSRLISKKHLFICKSDVSLSLSLHYFSKPCSFLCKSHVSSSTPTSSLCKSHVPFSLYPISTKREIELVASPIVYDVLVNKHHFSPQVASLVASDLTRSRSPEKVDSILSFLKESGFSSSQLEKIVKCKPRILTATYEDEIRLKLKIFRELGFSSEDIAQITSSNQVIFQLSVKNRIVPSLSVLKGLMGSDEEMVRLVKKCAWFVTTDLEKILIPNVEILKSFGIPASDIRRVLFYFPRFMLVKPEMMRKSIEKAKEMGASESSRMFIYAVRVIASMSDKAWERKLQAFRDMGVSDSEVPAMFAKAPMVFLASMKKIKRVKEVLVATGKFNVSSIVDHPCLLGCSIEKRLKPRLQIIGVLESKNLIKKWPSLGTIYTLSDDKFLDRFVRPYSIKVGKKFKTMSYLKAREKSELLELASQK